MDIIKQFFVYKDTKKKG